MLSFVTAVICVLIKYLSCRKRLTSSRIISKKNLRKNKSSLSFPTHSREAMDECSVECAQSLDHQALAQSPTVEVSSTYSALLS